MAIPTRIRTGVASPTAGDPFAHLDNLGYSPEVSIPDPRQAVQESIGSVPQEVPKGPTGQDLLGGAAQVNDLEDVQRFTGSRLPPFAQEEVILDDMGNPVLDEQGMKQFRQITPQDFGDQLAVTRAGFQDIADPIREIAQDPVRAQEPIRQLLEDRKDVSFMEPARSQEKLAKEYESLDHYINSVGSPLMSISNDAQEALMTTRTRAAAADQDGQLIPAGRLVLAKLGDASTETARTLATLAGLSLTKAVNQIGVKLDPKDGETETNPAPEGTQHMSALINAGASFLSAAFKNANMPLNRADAEFMMKHFILDKIARGHLVARHNEKTGQPILEATPESKVHARKLERLADVVTRSWSRPASSTTPNPSGVGFGSDGQRLTAKSSLKDPMIDKVLGGPLDTTAAELTKGILGSVAYVFRKWDFDRKKREIEMVLSPNFIQTSSDGRFMYSNHPLAERNGLGKSHYQAAMANVKKPVGFDRRNSDHVRRFGLIQSEDAVTVMEQKMQDVLFTLESIADKTGLRYAQFMHSPSNQRFYVNSYDLDYMGSKTIIRDVLGMANQDTTNVSFLFDPKEIANLKDVASKVFYQKGVDIHESLTRMNPSQLGALGALHAAVMFHYTVFEPGKFVRPAQLHIAEAIRLYTPEMGAKLADLGGKLEAFLADPSQEADQEMMGLWVATEKGEALGTLNLWRDFFKAKSLFDNPQTKNSNLPFTFHTFEDGNQNGIFLQSLFFGARSTSSGNDAVVSLGTANPNIQDLRRDTFDIMVNKIKDLMHDREELGDAWRAFWASARDAKSGLDGVARDFMKKPLMQAAYGKDAAMFRDVLLELLEVGVYHDLINEHFIETELYSSIDELAADLSHGVELALRQVIDTASMSIMKKLGRNFALLNTPAILRGITGDHIAISPVGVAPVNKRVSKNYVNVELPDGTKALIKEFQFTGDTIVNPETGSEVTLPDFQMQMMPSGSKGTQTFYNYEDKKYDEYDNPIGTSLANSLGVLLIQALDGDLVKWSTIKANEGLKVPRPVTWVHDSIISTPGQGLVYNNIYNNVAIPGAIQEIKKMGKRLKNALDDARFREIKAVKEKDEPVGIGSNGEYPAIGAYFDQQFDKIDPALNDKIVIMPDGTARTIPIGYKKYFLERQKTNEKQRGPAKMGLESVQRRWDEPATSSAASANRAEQKWNEFVAETEKMLKEAQSYGWIPKDAIPAQQRRFMAVTPSNFQKILELAETNLGTRGGRLNTWIDGFSDRVTNAAKNLFAAAGRGGIRQMGSSGGSPGKPPSRPVSYKTNEEHQRRPHQFKQVTSQDGDAAAMTDPFEIPDLPKPLGYTPNQRTLSPEEQRRRRFVPPPPARPIRPGEGLNDEDVDPFS